jgi:hypothetical protein
MRPIKVNADYESELFLGNNSAAINQALESLALFLEERPLYTHHKYAPEYLAYIHAVSGHAPQISTNSGPENWWGPLTDLSMERTLNSKETSARLVQNQGWCQESRIIHSPEDVPELLPDQQYLLKRPWGMSGQGFSRFDGLNAIPAISQALGSGPVLLEPLLTRKFDFSHYFFPGDKVICYENLVDKKFQYRGTVFHNLNLVSVNDLSFYRKLDPAEWRRFISQLAVVIQYYLQYPINFGFSVDSFVYEQAGKLSIRTLCEVNHRRTMGSVAYELASKYRGPESNWAMLVMGKTLKNFEQVKQRIGPLLLNKASNSGIIILSAGERFEMFLLLAKDSQQGRALLSELATLLPEAQLPV